MCHQDARQLRDELAMRGYWVKITQCPRTGLYFVRAMRSK